MHILWFPIFPQTVALSNLYAFVTVMGIYRYDTGIAPLFDLKWSGIGKWYWQVVLQPF